MLSIRRTDPNSGRYIREKFLKEGNPKSQLNSSCNPQVVSVHGSRNLQVAQGDRRYLPQDREGNLSNSRAHSNIFPPYNRTRKRREASTQTIHLGGSSSILFLVLTLLCVLGFILFTQKALVGARNMRDLEKNEVKREIATARAALEYFGEE